MSNLLITADEIMVACIARQLHDGETVAQGLATPLIAAAYLLARQTHAPHLYFMSAIGQGICRQPAPLGLARIEKLWLDRAINSTVEQVAPDGAAEGLCERYVRVRIAPPHAPRLTPGAGHSPGHPARPAVPGPGAGAFRRRDLVHVRLVRVEGDALIGEVVVD